MTDETSNPEQNRVAADCPNERLVMRCRLEVKNEILGDSVFWEGTREETNSIRNKPGRMVAEAVFRTGEPKSWGMWHGFPCA